MRVEGANMKCFCTSKLTMKLNLSTEITDQTPLETHARDEVAGHRELSFKACCGLTARVQLHGGEQSWWQWPHAKQWEDEGWSLDMRIQKADMAETATQAYQSYEQDQQKLNVHNLTMMERFKTRTTVIWKNGSGKQQLYYGDNWRIRYILHHRIGDLQLLLTYLGFTCT